jgi:protein-tyrosine phosphatase
MINKVLNWLYIGDWDFNSRILTRLNITHVLNVGGYDSSNTCSQVPAVYEHIHLNDGPNDRLKYEAALSTLDRWHRTTMSSPSSNVLIHCRAGMSRSPFVIALWLERHTGMNIHDAITFVKMKNPITMPAMDMVMMYVNEEIMSEDIE